MKTEEDILQANKDKIIGIKAKIAKIPADLDAATSRCKGRAFDILLTDALARNKLLPGNKAKAADIKK